MVEFLAMSGAEPNINLPTLGTPLALAAHKRRRDIAEVLLRYGGDINQRSTYPYSKKQDVTRLQRAAYEGDTAMVDLFLRFGAAGNAASGHFGPALVAATVINDLDLVKRLLDAGADINAMHRFGPTGNREDIDSALSHERPPITTSRLSKFFCIEVQIFFWNVSVGVRYKMPPFSAERRFSIFCFPKVEIYMTRQRRTQML
jgi:ankyrin repeat protein